MEDKNAAPKAESIYAGSGSYQAANCKLRSLADVDVLKATLQRRSGRIGQDVRESKREDVEAGAPSVDRILVEIDGTGVPTLASDVEGVFGKQEDGIARIREEKAIVSARQTAGAQRQGSLGRTGAARRGRCLHHRRPKADEACIIHFEASKDRMRYDRCRKRLFPVGSGVAESACKLIVGSLFNRAGPPLGESRR